MKTKDSGLDEMQKERRNSIGNQMFMLLFYALLIDGGLYGAGLRWLNYPANIMVILMVCMCIYLVRTITANAYLPPKAQNRKHIVFLIMLTAFSVVAAIAAVNLLQHVPDQSVVEVADDYSAIILFIISVVALLISLVAVIINKVNNKKENDK